MKNKLLCKIILGLLVMTGSLAYSQNVAINSTATAPVPSAVLDLSSNTTAGFLLPYMSNATMYAITAPIPNSLLMYDSTTNCLEGYFSRVGAAVPCNCWQALYCPCTSSPSNPVITGTQTLCISTSQTYSVSATPVGATVYTWTVPSGSGTFSNSSNTITGPSATQTVAWAATGGIYTMSVTATNSCGTNGTAGTLSITLNSGASATAPSPASQTVSGLGNSASAITETTSGPGLTYQWYWDNTGLNSGGTSLGAANGAQTATYTFPTSGSPSTTTAGTYYVYCVVSSSCTPTTATSSVATIIVNACVITHSSTTFTATGLSQWTVPCGITTCTVTAYGAAGGLAYDGGLGNTPANGAEAIATVAVTAGTVLNCYVGAVGHNASNNSTGGAGGIGGNSDETGGSGGGNANTGGGSGAGAAGGGGGASTVRLSTTTTFTDDIVSAAGGGGQGYDANGSFWCSGGYGGGSGSAPSVGTAAYSVGEEGTIGAAGAGGATTGFGCSSPKEIFGAAGGPNGNGGAGGVTDGATDACGFYSGGGGGGGGHYGGGGGCGGGGGGGYSYTGGAGTNTTSATSVIHNTAAGNSGNGKIVITW